MNSGDNNVIFGRRENNNLEEEKRKKKTRAEQVVNAADWRLFLALLFLAARRSSGRQPSMQLQYAHNYEYYGGYSHRSWMDNGTPCLSLGITLLPQSCLLSVPRKPPPGAESNCGIILATKSFKAMLAFSSL